MFVLTAVVALGLGYKVSERMTLDFAYAHLFVSDPQIAKSVTNSEDATRSGLIGSYDAHVNIVSAQLNYRF